MKYHFKKQLFRNRNAEEMSCGINHLGGKIFGQQYL